MLDKLISSFDTEHHVWTEEVAQDVEDEHDLVISGFRKDSAFRGYIWISETSGVYMESTSCTHGLTDGKRGIVSGVRFHSYHGEPAESASRAGCKPSLGTDRRFSGTEKSSTGMASVLLLHHRKVRSVWILMYQLNLEE